MKLRFSIVPALCAALVITSSAIAPAKESDVLHERDLLPTGASGDTQRLRRG